MFQRGFAFPDFSLQRIVNTTLEESQIAKREQRKKDPSVFSIEEAGNKISIFAPLRDQTGWPGALTGPLPLS
jgi:hypothetical protein